MALEIKLSQKLTQSLVMTQQLQQAIKLLQLGRLEYLEVIEKELLENPVLEDVGDDADEGLSASGSPEDDNHCPDISLNGETLKADADNLEKFPEKESFSDTLTSQDLLKGENVDWYEYLDGYGESSSGSSGAGVRSVDDENRSSIEMTVSEPEQLANHILWQLGTTDLPDEDRGIALHIVGNLDRDGYLQCDSEELSTLCNRSVEDIEKVILTIQNLDPPGIAARDLRECLMIQLLGQGLLDSLAWRIVSSHLSKLEIRHFDQIARGEGVAVEEVYEAVKIIQKLEPRPGRPFVDEAPVYITPDIYVHRVDDEDYVISLNETGMPRLRVNQRYKELLTSGEIKDVPNKEYIHDRLRSAAWLIRSIHQRQQTIFRITESIMKFQRQFLDEGVSVLKPLVLRDVAEDVGMHESTVSRVTTNKYVHTPQGVFELKFFFTSGLRGEKGDVSSESVKERIKALIASENSKKPFSDQALVNQLKSEGINVARRTVAKYREMLDILSSSRRKRMF